jgi:hypothetical protein
MSHYFRIGFVPIVLLAFTACAQTIPKAGEGMKNFATHPGTIRIINEADASIQILRAVEAPERQQFVYFDRVGLEVGTAELATERVPIEEVRMTPTDGKGNLVAKERAVLVRIKEYGAGQRLLRTTTMTPNPR